MIPIQKNIRPLLGTLVSGTASEQQINAVVRAAYNFSSQRLRQLLNSGRLHLHSFSISVEGIAFDCIAELFQRDEEGHFIELIEYFSGEKDLSNLDDEETIRHFRILVFCKVNQGIYRLYRENDPILARILRSLKLAIKADPRIKQLVLLGQIFLYTIPEGERNEHLPEYPLEEMERVLASKIKSRDRIPCYLTLFFTELNNQERYRRFYSIVDIAVVLKRVLAKKEIATDQVQYLDDNILEMDINQVLSESGHILKEMLRRKYVQTGKVPGDTFEKYWLAIEEMTYSIFVLNNGSEVSHPDLLKKYFSGLTTETYRHVHRTHFEYMARLTRNYVKEQLRELL